jgi:hypothetical protein
VPVVVAKPFDDVNLADENLTSTAPDPNLRAFARSIICSTFISAPARKLTATPPS